MVASNPKPNTGGELFNRYPGSLEAMASGSAPQPVTHNVQPDFPTSVPLQFTIDPRVKSNFELSQSQHYPNKQELRRLNLHASIIQQSAQWYLNTVSNSIITYFFMKNNELHGLRASYRKRHWAHLTGIVPIYKNLTRSVSEQFLEDCATGHTQFDNIILNQGFMDKIILLPTLPEIVQADAFILDDIRKVDKFTRLEADFALYSDDKNLMLLLRDTLDSGILPISLLNVNKGINKQLSSLNRSVILGVVREYNGHVETLSVNTQYITDNGAHMARIVRDHDYTIVHTRKSLEKAHHSPQKPTGFVR